MNGIPILTLLTALPIVGAIIAFFSGRHARGVAMIAALLSLAHLAGGVDAYSGQRQHGAGGAGIRGLRRWELSTTWAWMAWGR